MQPIDYLRTAKNLSETRKDKVFSLFKYFEKKNITKTKYAMQEMVGFTDEQIKETIEFWYAFEKSSYDK